MSDLTGKTIAGRYRVDEFIGRGGMAEVYKVWDTRRNTILAMKSLHADLALDRALIRRFHREAETLARLQHPNIVRFYGLEQDGEQIFMLMDFIEGKSLKQLIFNANGAMALPQILDIMRQLCQALQFAHYEGFVHADVKPANVLIDKTGRVMLNDFGIARMTETATATMGGAGTPAYMAPEQALGEKPTPQSDIYALGVVLYEMLTGERPFDGGKAKTRGSADEKVRWEQVNLEPAALHTLNPDITAELEQVALRALSKNPSQRYANALELSQALEAAIQKLTGSPANKKASIENEGFKPDEITPRRAWEPAELKTDGRRLSWLAMLSIGVFGLSLLVAFLANTPFFISVFANPTLTPTMTPTATHTPLQPSATASPAATPSATASAMPSPTSTPLVPVVMAKEVPINCRYGPGTGWEAVSALVLDTQAEIVGKNATLNYTWWYIKDPLNPGQFCWVAVDVTDAAGNLTILPVVPAPTAAVTEARARANVDFVTCGGTNPVAFNGTIKTNGPAEVTYQWEIAGDAAFTSNPEVLEFAGADTKSVAYPGFYNMSCGTYALKLHVTSPNNEIGRDDFSVPP